MRAFVFGFLALIAATASAQLPELGADEDVPRQAPLPPPAAGEEASEDDEPWAHFGETIDVSLSTHVV
ncbi:MAG TPA: hypothetical protein VKU40_03475, partial [Thermoanaerobaculia bacterium]|nr:hypothetical protein [Thermoanaerobaculia bacterium]